MSSTVWISKNKWDEVWAAIHNITVRQDFTVNKPSAGISGKGASARLRIDLPAMVNGGGSSTYDGPYAVRFGELEPVDEEDGVPEVDMNKVVVNGGFALANGFFFEVKPVELEIAEGYICVHIELNGGNGKWSEPVIHFAKPNNRNYPVARIIKEDTGYRIEQFYAAVAIFMLTTVCPLAEI